MTLIIINTLHFLSNYTSDFCRFDTLRYNNYHNLSLQDQSSDQQQRPTHVSTGKLDFLAHSGVGSLLRFLLELSPKFCRIRPSKYRAARFGSPLAKTKKKRVSLVDQSSERSTDIKPKKLMFAVLCVSRTCSINYFSSSLSRLI